MRCRKGSFAVATALILSILLMCVGLALDAGSAYQTRDRLQDAVDAAALAASAVMSENGSSVEKARAAALNMLKGQLSASGELAYLVGSTVNITQTAPTNRTETFTAEVIGKFELPPGPFQAFFTAPNVVFSVAGRATSGVQLNEPISVFLILDRSGSMQWVTSVIDPTQNACNNYYDWNWPKPNYQRPCYVTKIEFLKKAVGTLIDELQAADPERREIRVGGISYNDFWDRPLLPEWGTEGIRRYVSELRAGGGTNAVFPWQKANVIMTGSAEQEAHLAKNGGKPRKYIIFMTDGKNDYYFLDNTTLELCNNAKAAGITVFTVAYMAPPEGTRLLAGCASGPEYTFVALETQQLLAAFKTIGQRVAQVANRLSQ